MSKDPRVLFAIAHFDKGGGAAVQAYQLFQRLRLPTQGRCLCLSSSGSEPAWDEDTGIETLGRLTFPAGLLRLRTAIQKYQGEYDVVQALDSYYSLPAARLARARRLAIRIGADPVQDLGSRYGSLGRWAMRLVNPWLYQGTSIAVNAEHFIRAFPGRRARVIPNGVDVSRFPFPRPAGPARNALGLPADKPIVCFTGKVIPRKNLEDLFWLTQANPSLHLLLVGNRSEAYYGDAYYRELCRAFPSVVPRLHAVGEVPVNEIPRFLASADLFVFPSRLEGMPNSLLEAMAAGLPVIASDEPAHREVVAPGTGFLYRTREELASLTKQVLEDKTLSDETGRKARQHVSSRFSLEAAVESYLEMYRGMLEN